MERVALSLSRLLSAPDREVALATFDGCARTALESRVPIHSLGPVPELPLPLRPLSYALAARRLSRLKTKLRIDVTISNLWRADLISVLSGGRDRKIALCHINVLGNPTNRMMLRLRPLVAAVYRRCDRAIAVSQPLAREVEALYRLSSGRTSHIENFVDRPNASSCLPSDGRQRFVFCGRLAPEKNVEGLLHAWSDFVGRRSGAQLVIVGDGPLRGGLMRTAIDLGLRVGQAVSDQAEVVFTGWASNSADYMVGARALLLSSRAEGLPMVVLEALSLGVPVLASDCECGGVRSLLAGEGACKPNRERPEYVAAGALLPTPDAGTPSTLLAWREALMKASRSDDDWNAWRSGALSRASLFTSDAVRNRWLEAVRFEP